jgi:hypothetical protein
MSLQIKFKASKEVEGLVPEPIPAYKCFPEWFSENPIKDSHKKRCPFRFSSPDNPFELIDSSHVPTVRSCPGIIDFLKHGYIIKSWADFVFRETQERNLYINWVNCHTQMKYDNMVGTFPGLRNPPKYNSFHKILTPWFIETSPGVSCLITHPFWHRNKSFTSTTGIYHTDAVPMHIPWLFEWNYEINSGLNLDENFSVDDQTIKSGEPLILVIPFYRKNFQSKVEYLEDIDIKRMSRKIERNIKRNQIIENIYSKFRRNVKQKFI